jgi:glycosyltransferase involved in cell wall biosynthesis
MFYTPTSAKLIVTAARLDGHSGLDGLFAALKRLPEHYLWVIGDGESRSLLEEQAKEAGVKPRTRFIGWHDDVTPIIAAGDVFVYPATNEDVGDAVVEAWGANVPVVASDSLGPGLLINHQENGLLVPVGDAVSMAEAIKWICRDDELAKKLRESGKITYANTFAAEKVVPQYLRLFKQLASELAPKMGI